VVSYLKAGNYSPHQMQNPTASLHVLENFYVIRIYVNIYSLWKGIGASDLALVFKNLIKLQKYLTKKPRT